MRFRLMILAALAALAESGAAAAENATEVSGENSYACALYDDGSVWCWGALPGSAAEPPFFAERIEGLPEATAIDVGNLGACAVDRSGGLWCWGLDVQRALRGDDDVIQGEPAKVEGLPPVVLAGVGYTHVCAVDYRSRGVWCWGENACGEVGCGDDEPRSEPTQVPYYDVRGIISLSTGVNNTCAVRYDGALMCWGSDNPTMPGKGFVFESPEPLIFDVETMGRLREVANGRNFACATRRDGKVTCWGSNIFRQIGTDEPRLSDGYAAIGEVDGIDGAQRIDATYFNACAIDRGRVKCWGVGHPVFERDGTAPWVQPFFDAATDLSTGETFACAIEGGTVSCWGQEGFIPGMTPDKAVLVPGLPGAGVPAAELRDVRTVWRLIDRGALDDAAAAARELLDKGNPHLEGVMVELGARYYEAGRDLYGSGAYIEAISAFDGAETWLRERLALAETDADSRQKLADVHYRRGRAYQRTDDYNQALTDFTDAIRLDPQHRYAHRRLGDVAEELGDYELAVTSFERALEIRPDYEAALNQFAWLRLTAGLPGYRDPAEAVELSRRAVAFDEDAAYLDTLGAALARTGDVAGALESYARAFGMDPVYASRLAENLAFLGCLPERSEAPDFAAIERGLAACLDKGWIPFELSHAIKRIARIAKTDTALALAHLQALAKDYPDHPETERLEAAAREWKSD